MVLRALFFISVFSLSAVVPEKKPVCLIRTAVGNITVELYPEKARVTVSNFLQYAREHAYDSSSFFRVCTPSNEAGREIKIEVIQGGNVPESKLREPIRMENTTQTGLFHQDGTLSMARRGPHTAQSEFFICIGRQPELDYGGRRNPDGQGFAAFGQVTEGMDVVKKIQQMKEEKQYLVDPVVIYEVEVR